MASHAEHGALVAELTRRGFLRRAGRSVLGALILSADARWRPSSWRTREAQLPRLLPADATLQAFADTIIPGAQGRTAPTSATRSTRGRSPASTRGPARSRPTRSRSTTTR